ncbi:MAG TPA: hypothetical protein VFR37_01890 [Longimicrobium sp.]|nr:hypothetical protein [Longimicrobium sp.]
MSSVIPKDLRLRGLAAACALLAAAACGGGGDAAEAAAPAKSADSAAAPAAAAAPSGPAPAPAPALQPNAPVLDSAMTPAEAAEVAKSAPVQGPVNVEGLADYELTMPRVRQMVRASQNLALLQERRPELRDSLMIRTMDPNLLYQRINSIPEAREAVAQAGFTPQTYATATAALAQAILIYEYEQRSGRAPPVQFNEENVDFIAEHIQEILQMMREAGASMPPRAQQPGS